MQSMNFLPFVKAILFLGIAFAAIGVALASWAEGKGKY
jgi:hypothetical protein